MLQKFRERMNSEEYWENCSHPYIGRGVLEFYARKFIDRVDTLIKEKGIEQSSEYAFAKSLLTTKFRSSCTRYYDIESYSERDIEDDGTHLLLISECYEWLATELGISKSTLQDIRLSADVDVVDKMFEGIQ